jgi:hypothetical protein
VMTHAEDPEAYTRSQWEAWFTLNIGIAEREMERAVKRAAKPEAQWARGQLDLLQVGRADVQAGRQPHYTLVERFSRVCGSIASTTSEALSAGFVEGEGYVEASQAYHERQNVCWSVMRSWGWWLPGDPPTAAMLEELEA